jgi:fatty-acyl-CoA synthase
MWLRALEAIAPIADDPTRVLPNVVNELARRLAKKPALLSDRETLTYGELAARMNRYSRWALAEGIERGDTVCLLMPNRPDFAAVWLGITQVGGVVALLNTNLTGAALAHCIGVAAPRHIIVAAELAEAFATAEPLLTTPIALWRYGHSAFSGQRIDVAVEGLGGQELAPGEGPAPTLSDRALCIYTSGTTGLPKAANISHRRVMTWSYWFAGFADIGEDDRMYNCLPLYHSVGGVVAIGATLVRGGSAVIAERFSAQAFWDDVTRWDCTVVQYIGEMCRYLLAAPRGAAEQRHRLRLCCGNGMAADVWAVFQDRFAIPRVLEFYASTEGNFSLYNAEGKIGSIGRVPGFLAARNPIALVEFDFERGEPRRNAEGFCVRCKISETGEAIARIGGDGGGLASGFEGYTSPTDTNKKILRNVFTLGDAWFRSGDLMRCDGQGFYFFVDRIGDTFRWKAENVSTMEVASALRAVPRVVDAAVYGVPVPGADGRAGMALLAATEALDLVALAEHLRTALPDYARPVFLRVSAALAVTATFKHQKQALMREGFDPALIADPLYVFDRGVGGYVPLDAERYAAIQSGAMRL